MRICGPTCWTCCASGFGLAIRWEVTAAMVDDQALQSPPKFPWGPRGTAWAFGEDVEMLYHPSVAVAATFKYADCVIVSMSG